MYETERDRDSQKSSRTNPHDEDNRAVKLLQTRKKNHAHGVCMVLFSACLPSRDFLPDALQAVQRFVEGLVFLGKMQADQMIHRLAEEAGAGDCAHAHIPGKDLAEFQVGVEAELGDVQQDVVCALRSGVGDADVVEAAEEEVALGGVLIFEPLVICIPEAQAGHGCFLQGGGGADGEKVVYLLRDIHDVRRGDDVPQPPAGDGIGLGQGGAGDRPLPHARQGGKIAVLVRCVNDMLVHLVGDDEGVVSLGQVGDQLQLVIGEDLAAGIGGIAEDQRLGMLVERRLQLVCVKVEFRRVKRDIDRLRARENGVCAVVFVEGGEDDHLVARIGNGHHGCHHGLGAAAGDDDLAVGVDLPSHQPGLLLGQGFAEVLRAPGDRILVKILPRDFGQPVEDLFWRLEVGEPLGKIHRAVLQGYPGHAADHRIGEGFGSP